MLRDLLPLLRCPYCGGAMRLKNEVEADLERVRYGLLACRCFEFPIVDGIPLLSLAKGYGGAEEELQPYVPLQVAAINHLQRNDINGLRIWIRRHLPLANALMEGRFSSYLEFAAARDAQVDKAPCVILPAIEPLAWCRGRTCGTWLIGLMTACGVRLA